MLFITFFLAYCLAAGRIVKRTLGLLPLAVIIIGLSSFVFKAGKPSVRRLAKKQIVLGRIARSYVNIEKFGVATIQLAVTYDSVKVYGSNAHLIGCTMGHSWHPADMQVAIKNGMITYFVSGEMRWEMLGYTLYVEKQVFNGNFKADS